MPKLRTKKNVFKQLSEIERYISYIDYINLNITSRLPSNFDIKVGVGLLDLQDRVKKSVFEVRKEVKTVKKLLSDAETNNN
jgi:hypothetical protein